MGNWGSCTTPSPSLVGGLNLMPRRVAAEDAAFADVLPAGSFSGVMGGAPSAEPVIATRNKRVRLEGSFITDDFGQGRGRVPEVQ